MDLETENRIAAILLKEAAELRRQAQQEGALAYLRQPTVRSRPNSRFLTATVRGVQQANRVVEVNEMWRIREKQLELDNRLRGARNENGSRRRYKDNTSLRRSRHEEADTSERTSLHSNKHHEYLDPNEDDGLKDDEVDEFLHSRRKRGRGSVGSRMDEAGPYPSCPDFARNVSESSDEGEQKKARILLGPKKPNSLKSSESSDSESHKDKRRKKRIESSDSSDNEPYKDRKKKKGSNSGERHSKKHKSKEKSKSKDTKKKRREKKRRHHK